jgi:hypothetical protein
VQKGPKGIVSYLIRENLSNCERDLSVLSYTTRGNL